MEPKGRGRGLALLQALKKETESSSGSSPSPDTTPGPSVSPSIASGSGPPSMLGGRGRAAHLLAKMNQPGGGGFSPASDVSPSTASSLGVGRGLKLLQNLQASRAASSVGGGDDVSCVTQTMASTTISAASTIPKNKPFREVNDEPPVIRRGENGTPIEVTANFIRLQTQDNAVYEYEVKYEPNQDYRNLRFQLLNQHNELFKTKTFDGTTLYVPHQLPESSLNLVSVNPFDQEKVNVTIVFRRTRRLSEMIHVFNVMFKNIMKDLELVRFGRQYYNERSSMQIPQHKLEVWPGYVTAVDEYEGGLMLTLDSTHRVLRTQSVLSFIKEKVNSEGTNWKRALTESLIGCSVMTTYNKKLFRVDSIDEKMTPKSTFERNEKGQTVQITFIDYYKKNYGIDIMDWEQPMLISRETKRVAGYENPVDFMICLVPELCQLTGLTEDQRKNFGIMKDVATYTCITPNQRHFAFKQFLKNVLANEKAKSRLAGWGLTIAPETIDLTARVFPAEAIMFGNNVKVPGKPSAEWNNEVTRNHVMTNVELLRWVLLYTPKDKKATMDFVEAVKRNCRPMGLNFSSPEMVQLPNDRTDAYIAALKKSLSPAIQLIVAICPTSRDDRYAAIKRICCVDNPIPSQVINARTIFNQNKLRSVTQKILLQINCKLGGTLWHIAIPYKTAMVIGIDSYHEAGRKKNSVVGFVASYNPSLTQWYSRVVFQEKGQEILDHLKSCFIDSLKHYIRVNNRLPDRIIIYRDGVGDGQLKLIQEYEIPQMKVCFKVLGENYSPMMTYIVVQKRINTRIFLKGGQGYENPPPGTVMDHDITRRNWYDFLIVSQKVTKGTVTPTHYVVVYDDSGMPPDYCQRLTYKMCHLYFNWPGTVRVPAPCQYAHKLAYLVGQNVRQTPSNTLADKLYFL